MLKNRRQSGVATIVLVLILAVFIMLPLGLLGFEIARYNIILSQLQSVADASALAGTAALASAPEGLSYEELNKLAMKTAVQTFQQNSILGTNFNSSNVKAVLNETPDMSPPPANHATVNVTLLDIAGNQVPTDSKDKTAVKMRVTALYSDHPAFSFLDTLETATATADGGLPQIDVFLCFDISGSMDDQTEVHLVRRFWNPGANTVSYTEVNATAPKKDIYNLFLPPKSGTGLNCAPPMNLSYASYPSPSNLNAYEFSEGPFPSPNKIKGLRANRFVYPAGTLPAPIPSTATQYPTGTLVEEQGLPPGNFDPQNPPDPNGNGIDPAFYPKGFTDMVVKVPDQPGYPFPNIATCVEASRGNLEDAATLKQSQGTGISNPTLAAPKAGYYNAYWTAVQNSAQPMAAARAAAANFFKVMNISSNGHFGFQSFSDLAGTPGGTWDMAGGSTTNQRLDKNYTLGGTGIFRTLW